MIFSRQCETKPVRLEEVRSGNWSKQKKLFLKDAPGAVVMLPWNGTMLSFQRRNLLWARNPSTLDDPQDELSQKAATVLEVTLFPSPGEQFSLKVSCYDEIFNQVKTTIFAQVSNAL